MVLNKSSLGEKVTITVPSSKSISNRALIINALCPEQGNIHNLSAARDTQTMQRLLLSNSDTLDVLDAGTTMRFLTAYITVTNQSNIITGTERMQQRPISILVDALRELGGDIEYVNKEGYPPLHINGFAQRKQSLRIRGDVSSQYISALLMIAPILENGLQLTLDGKVGSKPYIDMTLALMKHYGVEANWIDNLITISRRDYQKADLTIEPDWSGASYWYSLVALSKNGNITLNGFKEESLQGDKAIAGIMDRLGVATQFTENGLLLSKKESCKEALFDFADCPDLAQTVAVVCAAKGIQCTMTGLESLKIKETNRVLALQNELAKLDAELKEESNQWTLYPSNQLPNSVVINTYEDHRMAMAFAPLCMLMDVTFEDESVVNKSYPSFWKDLENATI